MQISYGYLLVGLTNYYFYIVFEDWTFQPIILISPNLQFDHKLIVWFFLQESKSEQQSKLATLVSYVHVFTFSLKGDIFTQIFMPHYYVSKSRYLNYPPLWRRRRVFGHYTENLTPPHKLFRRWSYPFNFHQSFFPHACGYENAQLLCCETQPCPMLYVSWNYPLRGWAGDSAGVVPSKEENYF